ncbi:hypothetical protein SRHO_G00335700 [Serrasalmus rhombeus]
MLQKISHAQISLVGPVLVSLFVGFVIFCHVTVRRPALGVSAHARCAPVRQREAAEIVFKSWRVCGRSVSAHTARINLQNLRGPDGYLHGRGFVSSEDPTWMNSVKGISTGMEFSFGIPERQLMRDFFDLPSQISAGRSARARAVVITPPVGAAAARMVSPSMKALVDAVWAIWSIVVYIYDYIHTSAMEERIHTLENVITVHQCVIGLLTAGLVVLFTYILLRKH